MIKHNLFNLLRTFTPEEIKRFGDFINSPYFNQRTKPYVLYKLLVKSYPGFADRNLEKKKLYRKIFNLPDYKDSSLRNLFANLMNLAEEFIAIENFGKEKFSNSNYLLEELILRNQPAIFTKNVKRIKNELLSPSKIDFNYLFARCQFEKNLCNFSLVYDKITSKRKIYPQVDRLNGFAIYLTAYYTTEIISQYFDVIGYADKFNIDEIPLFINEILESFNIGRIYKAVKGKNECDIIFEMYLALYSAFLNFKDVDKYYIYKGLVDKYHSRLSSEELCFHYTVMISYCILKSTRGENDKEKFREELLALYETELEQEYYKSRKTNYLPESLFRDILFLSIRMKRVDLLKKLATDYSSKVHPDEKYNMTNFANAFYYYETRNYEASLRSLNRIKLDYFIYKYDVKNLMLRIDYDMNYCEEVLSLIHSYREFLRKDEFLSPARKQRHRTFIQILGKMALIKSGNSHEDAGFLKEKIISSNVSYKNWLLERIGELEKNRK